MSVTATQGSHESHHDEHHDGHHDHPKWLAHHYETPRQQHEANKFGIWLFLAQEVLFFSGLFCAYTYYRMNNPELFKFAHHFLDTKMGAINTVVLIFSSFTMAAAVRCAQMENRKWLLRNLWITLGCAGAFMVIKAFEYSHKFHLGLFWGDSYDPAPEALADVAAKAGVAVETLPSMHQFFSIYYCMTGLHGLHVIAGMIAIGWVLRRAYRGDFNRYYFSAVDSVGLYWHIVDLVWIFLFPLMYLIR